MSDKRKRWAAYDGSRPPSLGNVLASSGSWIWIARSDCGCNKAIPLAPLIERFGIDALLPFVQQKLRCQTCGKNPESFSLPSLGPINVQPPIPLDRVPDSLRCYVLIDPLHLPAPLRGNPHCRVPA